MAGSRTRRSTERGLLEASGARDDDGLVLVDADGRVRLVDHRARTMLGDAFVLHELAPALVLANDVVLVTSPGAERPDTELRVGRASVDGREGWAITVSDVARRRSPAEEASALVATVCHEMRTPLTSIVGYADALRVDGDEMPAQQRTQFAATILRQGERLARLVTDLAVLSQPGRSLELRTEVVRVGEVVDEVLDRLGSVADGVEVAGDRTLTVRVDRDHLADIVTNLLTNAAKYGRPPVVVELERQDFQGVVRVRDAGPGVPEGFVDRMWDRFSRARVDERPPEASGSGLGLAIVAGLAEANQGHAWYEPAEPTGACFAVAFRRDATSPPAAEAPPDEH